MNKLLFLLIIAPLISINLKAQSPIQTPNISQPIPPSPTAASLGKYGETPVGKYTGTPDINIPLYAVTEGDIQVPISLSYHASGVKVEENASWVGLGWSLNAGGVITRSVRGKPDEIGYLLNSSQYTSISSGLVRNDLIPALLFDPNNLGPNASFCDVEDACEYATAVRDGTADSEPDIYYFNFNGLSGKFVLDQNGVAYTIPYQKINIQKIDNNTWNITTPDGMKYTFGTAELTTSSNLYYQQYGGATTDYSGVTTSTFPSSWYLSKIQSPTGHQVLFSYDVDYSDNISGTSQTLLWTSLTTSNDLIPTLTNSGSESLIHGWRLKQINFSSGSVNFIANTARTDINDVNNPNLLEKIVINNQIGAIKQFVFNTDYFTSSDAVQSYQTRRLRLNSVTEWNGSQTLSKPPYQFTYDNTYPLPSKISTSQDHWGFYNGKTNLDKNNIPTLIPNVNQGFFGLIHEVFRAWSNLSTPISDNNYPYYRQIVYKGADRSSDFNYAKAGILTKITYPTGGYTSFLYEPQDYVLDPADYVHSTQPYSYSSSSSNDNNINQGLWTTVVDNGIKCTNTQTINPSQYINASNSDFNSTVGMNLSFTFTNGHPNEYGSDDIYCCGFNLPEAIFKDVTTNTNLLYITGRAGVPQIIDPSIQTQINDGTAQISGDFTIPYLPGSIVPPWNNGPIFYFNGLQLNPSHTYTLTTITYHNQPGDCFDSRSQCPQPTGEIFTTSQSTATIYIEGSTITQYNGTVGGLRIKQISDYSTAGAPVVKQYSYKSSANPQLSSGVISDLPIYFDKHQLAAQVNGVVGPDSPDQGQPTGWPTLFSITTLDELIFTSGSKFELGQTSGSFVGYKEVQESYCPDNTCATLPIGKKIYKYTSFADYPDINSITYGSVFWGDIAGPCSNTQNVQFRFELRWRTSSNIDMDAYHYPYPPKNNYDWKRGLPLSEETYDQAGVLKKSVVSTYNLSDDPTNRKIISGLKLATVPETRKNDMFYGRYDYVAAWNYKKQDVVTEYDNNNAPFVTTTNYFYDNPDHALLTRTETINSKGETLQEKNKYVGDESSITGLTATESDAITKLKAHFRYSILEKEANRNGVLISRVRTGYNDWGNNIIEPQNTKIQIGNNPLEVRASYQKYDTGNGNLLQSAKTLGASVAYQWGYNKQYPVAEVKNAANNDIFYDSFEEGNGTLNDPWTGHFSFNGSYSKSLTALDPGTYTLSYWLKTGGTWSLIIDKAVIITGSTYTITIPNSQIDDVRFYPTAAQMTTYTYDPLIGMTSSTDPKSLTTYYEYDDFQRLMNIKDKDGNIVKHMDYHYKGQ